MILSHLNEEKDANIESDSNKVNENTHEKSRVTKFLINF